VKENNNEPTQQKQTVTKEDEDFIDKLNKLINDNMAGEELSIKFLTDNMAMSRASLYHKVKTLTGLGVNDYINRLRIEKSVYLLTNTNLNINEISYEVGFTYPRYFSTSFKQIKGMTPTQFKEEKKKNNADSK
jgi:two-component system sensor histidine kinase/response regulator hybrid